MELIFIFKPRVVHRWWNKWFKEEYHHIQILSKREFDPAWVVMDWTAHRLDAITMRPGEMYSFCRDSGGEILSLEVDENELSGNTLFKAGPITCVSNAMQVIGKYRWYVHTPWQFQRFISKLGAVNVTNHFKG